MPHPATVTIKSSYDGDAIENLRKFTLDIPSSHFASLRKHLIAVHRIRGDDDQPARPPAVVVSYKDEDGDLVTLDSDRELQDLLSSLQAKHEGAANMTLRIYVRDREDLDFEFLNNHDSGSESGAGSDLGVESDSEPTDTADVESSPLTEPEVIKAQDVDDGKAASVNAETETLTVETESAETQTRVGATESAQTQTRGEATESAETQTEVDSTPVMVETSSSVASAADRDNQLQNLIDQLDKLAVVEGSGVFTAPPPESAFASRCNLSSVTPTDRPVTPAEDLPIKMCNNGPFAHPVCGLPAEEDAKSSSSSASSRPPSYADLTKRNLPPASDNMPVGLSENLTDAEESWKYSSTSAGKAKEKATDSAAAPKPAEPLSETEQFIHEIQPHIDGLTRCLEAKPHMIPLLASILPSTLGNHNFGLIIENSDAPAPAPTSGHASRHAHRHPAGPRGPRHHARFGIHPHRHDQRAQATLWSGVVCDGCSVANFSGVRYKCDDPACPDYDLCGKCFNEISVHHPSTHAFFEIHADGQLHRGVSCDGCGRRSLVGCRFKCVDCPDYDLCSACIPQAHIVHKAGHWFNRIDAEPSRRVVPFVGTAAFVQPAQPIPRAAEATAVSEPEIFSEPSSTLTNPFLDPLPATHRTTEEPAPTVTEGSSSSMAAPVTTAEDYERAEMGIHGNAAAAFGEEMDELVAMGFFDIEVNKRLLSRHRGQFSKVVEILLRRNGELEDEGDEEYFF
ncbi:hypothetical protein HK101_004706 [Irineochytrium annulatum]|nr:hypothetical protein HK101_004706 [Irineochytrium annulatum]